MTMNYPMTITGKKKLEEELAYLKNEKKKELNEQIEEHRSYCDFSDNTSFSQTLEQQAILNERVATIEEMLLNAKLISPADEEDSVVRLGSTVTFIELPDGPEETYTIVGSIEADSFANKISIDSPIGIGLLGSEKDEELQIDTPAGNLVVKVLDVF